MEHRKRDPSAVRRCPRKKKARSTWDRAFPVCAAGDGRKDLVQNLRDAVELPEQPRVPQESHLRKLLSAAHTYSQNWSRITSISTRPTSEVWGRRPCQAVAGFTSRVTVGPGLGGDSHRPLGRRP